MRDGGAIFEALGLRFRYPGASAPAIADVSLRVDSGGMYGIIGPNGSGKSTLLKLLLGALSPESGEVRHAGRPRTEWDRRDLARRVGVVPQREEVAFPLTVRELVAMGRYPHLGPWRPEGTADREAVREAMERCRIAPLAPRPFASLSGGEAQLARIARALAGRPESLVLDEPTVSLDIRHEMEIFELLRELVSRDGVTVVLVTHNLNAAARFADRLLLLDGGRRAAEGVPRDVLTKEIVERVYRWPVRVASHGGRGSGNGAPRIVPLSAEALAPD